MNKKTILSSFTIIGIASYGTYQYCFKFPEMKTVDYVDIDKYAGKWYEIAKIPMR